MTDLPFCAFQTDDSAAAQVQTDMTSAMLNMIFCCRFGTSLFPLQQMTGLRDWHVSQRVQSGSGSKYFAQNNGEQRLLVSFRNGNGYFHLGQSAAETAYRLEGALFHQPDPAVFQARGEKLAFGSFIDNEIEDAFAEQFLSGYTEKFLGPLVGYDYPAVLQTGDHCRRDHLDKGTIAGIRFGTLLVFLLQFLHQVIK